MTTIEFEGESPKNFEQKCHCVLVLDTSRSMAGKPIEELNEGLSRFVVEIKNDATASVRLEVSIIAFNSVVEVIQTPTLVDDLQVPTLSAKGTTKLVDAVRQALKLVEDRKTYYRETGQTYARPYVILISDGRPDPGQDTIALATEIQDGVEGKHFHFWCFYVNGADVDCLKGISHASFKPVYLVDSDFISFFQWLSNSMSTISSSREGETVQLEQPQQFQIEV